MRNVSGLEAVYQDYAPRGVKFFYIYKTVQHPGVNNFIAPFTLEERLLHVAEAKRRTGSKIPWLCDTMENDTKHALGNPPNGEFVIDPQGKIVRKRFWSNPRSLRADLEQLVGVVKEPTQVEDLDAIFQVEPRPVASGVVKRPALPALQPIKTTPHLNKSSQKFFVKLRAEAEPSLLAPRGRTRAKSSQNAAKRRGKLYLGFFLDPLYSVHWNNRAGRIQVEVSGDGYEFQPATMRGPEVKEDADVDPREFLVDVNAPLGRSALKPLKITVKYIACDDEGTFCLPVTQHYEITLERDSDGGSRPGVFMPRMFAGVADFDSNGDGNITIDELPPGRVTLYLGHLDLNDDEIIDAEERKAFDRMFNNGRGFQAAPPKE